MTNTLNNVPRELLADLLGNDRDKRIMAERHLLAMLANAPSPAGVDGLETVGYVSQDDIKWQGDCTLRLKPYSDYVIPLCRLSDAKAIIDGLRGEVDQQALRIGELASHLEFAVTMLTVAGLAGNAQVKAMRSALSAGKEVG